MLPNTGLFLLGKVALQMRIRRRLKIFRRPFDYLCYTQPHNKNRQT